jgi:hypothetical protein
MAQAMVVELQSIAHTDLALFLIKIDHHAVFDLQRMMRFLLLLPCHQKYVAGR